MNAVELALQSIRDRVIFNRNLAASLPFGVWHQAYTEGKADAYAVAAVMLKAALESDDHATSERLD
jgi:hypothetical protein